GGGGAPRRLTVALLAAPGAPQLGERAKTASWLGSGGESEALGSTHYLHVAAGKAGATIFVRPEHLQTRRPGSSSARRLRCRACDVLPRRLCRPRHGIRPIHRAPHARLRFRPETKSRVGGLDVRAALHRRGGGVPRRDP